MINVFDGLVLMLERGNKTLFLLLILSAFCHGLSGQVTPLRVVEKPSWVSSMPLPVELFENDKQESHEVVTTYQEIQINVITNQTYKRTVLRIEGEGNETFNFSKNYYPADDSLWLIDFKWTREGVVRTQWERSREFRRYYQINDGVFHAEKQVQFYGSRAKKGDVLEIELLTENVRSDIMNLAIPEYGFGDNECYHVRVISASKLSTVEIQGMPRPKVRSFNDGFEYVWEGVGAFNGIKNNPSWRFLSARFSASPFENNKEMLQWKMPLYELDEPSKIAIKRKQEVLTQGLNDLENKIVTILNYVQDSITYQEYGLYAPRMPYRTIADGYGDCKSKSLLGVELLKEAGVSSWPIMVNLEGYEYQFKDLATPQKFNHCVIQYVYDQDTFTVDPTIKKQGDLLGEQYHNPFRKGLRLQDGEVNETAISSSSASTLYVYDNYKATDHSILRKVIATGYEANKLRRVYEYHGLGGLHKIIKYTHRVETGYEHTLDLGYGYRALWRREGPASFRDLNSNEANRVEIEVSYAIANGPPDHFTGFDLDHFRQLVREYPVAEEIEEVGFKEPISITHRLKIEANNIHGICEDSLTNTQVELGLNDDIPAYSNRVSVFTDSVILEQSFHVPVALSFEEALKYNDLFAEINRERGRMRELPKLYNKLLPDDNLFETSWVENVMAIVGSLLFALFLIGFFIVGIVHLVKGKRRKRRLKRIRLVRAGVFLVALVMLQSFNVQGQNTSLTELPNWVDTYAPDSSLKGNEQIQIIQKEVQVNDISKEVFYRNIYEVNRKGPSQTCFLGITYDASVETLELVAFHVDRNGKQVSMMPGLIQRNEDRIVTASGIVLKNIISLYFHNDLFKSRDLVTIAYVKKPKEGCTSHLSEYSFEANEKGLGCKYIFSVISKSGILFERHFQGFEKPMVVSSSGDEQKWIWNKVFELKTGDRFFSEPKEPSWFNVYPHIYVFSSSTEQRLAEESLKLPRFVFQDESLQLLFQNMGQNPEAKLNERIFRLDRYIRDSLYNYAAAAVNSHLSYTSLVSARGADLYRKSVLFSKALSFLGVENELFLVKEGGLDSSHAQVLSTELFSHAIVRYQNEGFTCYFDPIHKGVGKQLNHYRKDHYRYGLNLTAPTDGAELFIIPRAVKNQLTIRDTVLRTGKLMRRISFEGDFASDVRDAYYTKDYPLKERLVEGFGSSNVFQSDLLRLRIPTNHESVDSFSYADEEDGRANLYLLFDINMGDSIDPSSDSGHYRTVELYGELQSIYSDGDLDEHTLVRRVEIEIAHSITVPDEVLSALNIPDIHLESSTATFDRSSSYSKGLFTLDVQYNSTTDFMTEELYDQQFYWDMSYDAIPYHTLSPDGLMQYQRDLERESGRSGERVVFYMAVALMLCGAAIVLFGLYKTIQGFRKKRKRKARLKHLMAHS